MFIPSITDASASTDSHTSASTPTTLTATLPPAAGYYLESVRHMLFGTLPAVQSTIRLLHIRGYAEPNDWSDPIPTGRPNEVMVILTKRVRLKPQS